MFEKSLHGLRGAAAFSVFIAHCAGGYAQHLCKQCSYSHILDVINNVGTFGVELFFFISGFVIFLSSLKSDPLSFVKRRFWRIYPVLFFFTILFAFGNNFLYIEPEKNRLDYLLFNLTFTNLLANTPALTPNAWTITYEVMFYFFTYLCVYFGIRQKNLGLLVLVMAGAAIFFIGHAISMYFAAGVLLAALDNNFRFWRTTVPTAVIRLVEVGSILTIFTLSSSEHIYNWVWLADNPSTFILVFSVFLFVACLLHPASWVRRLLELKSILYLGTISYSLYLAHPYSYLVTRSVINIVGRKALIPPEFQFFVFSLSVVISTLVFSVAVHRLVEVPFYQRMTGKKIVGV